MIRGRPPPGPWWPIFRAVTAMAVWGALAAGLMASEGGRHGHPETRRADVLDHLDVAGTSARFGLEVRDDRPWNRPDPRAAVVAPPTIVKILRRGGHEKSLRGPGSANPAAAGDAAALGFGARASQAILIANTADIVRLCRWLL